MRVATRLHDQLIHELGLSMLNTLMANSPTPLRRIPVFDERGGMMAGCEDRILEFQDLTTGIVRSRQTGLVGVRYRCRPHALTHAEVGAFHTHPVLYSRNIRTIKRRIDALLWLSDPDVEAFRQQHARLGMNWHFIAALDLGCFHIDDVRRGHRTPRLVIRTPDLVHHVRRLEPEIAFFDEVLRVRRRADAPPELLDAILARVTGCPGETGTILGQLPESAWADLGDRVLRGLLQIGLQPRGRGRLFERVAARLERTTELLRLQDLVEMAWIRMTTIPKPP